MTWMECGTEPVLPDGLWRISLVDRVAIPSRDAVRVRVAFYGGLLLTTDIDGLAIQQHGAMRSVQDRIDDFMSKWERLGREDRDW